MSPISCIVKHMLLQGYVADPFLSEPLEAPVIFGTPVISLVYDK
jgi:hypothetical protein